MALLWSRHPDLNWGPADYEVGDHRVLALRGQPHAHQPFCRRTQHDRSERRIVALEDPNNPGQGKTYADVPLNGASGTPGNTMGLAFANDRFTLYGVTDQGQFLQNISTFTAVPGNTIAVSINDPNNPGAVLSGSSLRFAALALGPQDVENGRYANMFFAITDTGILTALDTNGEPQVIFDTDGDGVSDSNSILTGASQLGGTVTGLAFSPYDFNLWHPTFQRQFDSGHSMGGPSGLATSQSETLDFPAGGRQQDRQNASFYFGFEPWTPTNNPGYANSDYQIYGFASGSPLPTGNADLLLNNGQFGLIDAPAPVAPNFFAPTSDQRQRELSINPLNDHSTYNTPVGAYGKMETDKFSLAGMSASDKPTFYFDYFLDTEDKNTNSRAGIDLGMRDSARVYIGPFTRFDTAGGPFVTGSVADPAATPTSFKGFSPVTLSGVDGFYNGKALRFTSGPLSGQVHIITGYVGATRTFSFKDGFTAAPGNNDAFSIAFGYVTWDLVATNNSFLDNPTSSGDREGELPTFVSTSTTALPSNPRQQVQLMHDNTGQWRQARVDLSRYAGQTGLQLRFDFSTAGEMPDPQGHVPSWENEGASPANIRGVFPPQNVVAAPGQEYLFEDGFGELSQIDKRQDNDHEGFYIDNIIIGPAERGEMVINAPANTNFTDLATPNSITQPRNYDPLNAVPTQVLTGPYQLEIRRGAEYGLSDGGPLNTPNYSQNSQTPILVLDTNDRLIPDQRLGTPIPAEGFESQNFTTLKWGFNDDAPWVISSNANSGAFSAASGKIVNGQSSGLSIDLITGSGNLTFARRVDSEAADPSTGKRGDVLRLFIDGRLATYTAVNDVALASPQLAEWSGSLSFEKITVPIAAGHHNFRWTYDKDSTDVDGTGQPLPIGQDKVFLDDIRFPTPQLGFENTKIAEFQAIAVCEAVDHFIKE
jgi:hypothetical protein